MRALLLQGYGNPISDAEIQDEPGPLMVGQGWTMGKNAFHTQIRPIVPDNFETFGMRGGSDL